MNSLTKASRFVHRRPILLRWVPYFERLGSYGSSWVDLRSRNYCVDFIAERCATDCADNATFFDVLLGAHNVRLPASDEPTRVEMRSTECTIHPNWGPRLLRNDMALIKLPTPVEFMLIYVIIYMFLIFYRGYSTNLPCPFYWAWSRRWPSSRKRLGKTIRR